MSLPINMGVNEVIEVTQTVRGTVVAHHLEALSHCPVTRTGLRAAAARAGVGERLRIPEDGEALEFSV